MADKDVDISLLMEQGKPPSEKHYYKGLTSEFFKPGMWKLAGERKKLPKKDIELLDKLKLGEDGNYNVLTEEQAESLSQETYDYLMKEKTYKDKDKEDPNAIANFFRNIGIGFAERVRSGTETITGSLSADREETDPLSQFFPQRELEDRVGEAALGLLEVTDAPMGGLSKAMVPDEWGEGGRLAFELGAPFAALGIGKLRTAKKMFSDLGPTTEAELRVIENMRKTGKINEHEITELIQQHRIKTMADEAATKGPTTLKEINFGKMDEITDAHMVLFTEAGRDMVGLMGSKTPFRDALGVTSAKASINKLKPDAWGRIPESVGWDWGKIFKDIAAVRNAFLVSSFSTSMRNAETVFGFFGIQSVDEALQGIIRAATGRKAINEKELGASLTFMNDLFKAKFPFSPGENIIDKVIRAHSDTLADTGLFKRTVFESGSTTGKVQAAASVASVLNNMQEYFFRRIAFEARLRNKLKGRGVPFDTARIKDFSPEDLEEATHFALRMTFAKDPDRIMKRVLKELTTGDISPYFKLFAMPFPRFVFGNAIPFMYEFSPLGYLSALSPRVMRKLASGDPDEFAKYASRAMIGSSMLTIGMNLRGGSTADIQNPDGSITRTRWYEASLQGDDGQSYVVDLRPFAPLIGPYMYMAEAVLHPENLGMSDIAELFFGLNRLGATGLVVLDSFIAAQHDESGDMEELIVGKSVGSLLGSVVPKLVEGVLNVSVGMKWLPPEATTYNSDAIYKIEGDATTNTINQMLATFKKNIPYYRQKMPRAYDAIDMEKGMPQIMPALGGATNDFFKELTGFRVTKVHPVRSVMKGLHFKQSYGGSKIGYKPFDNLVNAEIAIAVNAKGGLVDQIKSPEFRKKGFHEKKQHIREFFTGKNGAIWNGAMKVYTNLLSNWDIPINRQIVMQAITRQLFEGDVDLRQAIARAKGMSPFTRPENVFGKELERLMNPDRSSEFQFKGGK